MKGERYSNAITLSSQSFDIMSRLASLLRCRTTLKRHRNRIYLALILSRALQYCLDEIKRSNKARYQLRINARALSLEPSRGHELWNEVKRSFSDRKRTPSSDLCLSPLSHISFAGGGFRTIAYLGQLFCLTDLGLLSDDTCYYGASLGAVFSAAVCFGVYEEMAPDLLNYCVDVFQRPFHMWGLCRHVFRKFLAKYFPEDISRAQGRVHVSITYLFPYPHNALISEFADKSDLIECILASMHVPMYTRGPSLMTYYRGRPAVDGGLTVNDPMPALAEEQLKRRNSIVANTYPSQASLNKLVSSSSIGDRLALSTRESKHVWLFKAKEQTAPLFQILHPPPIEKFMDEIMRGYGDAEEAIMKQVQTSVADLDL